MAALIFFLSLGEVCVCDDEGKDVDLDSPDQFGEKASAPETLKLHFGLCLGNGTA